MAARRGDRRRHDLARAVRPAGEAAGGDRADRPGAPARVPRRGVRFAARLELRDVGGGVRFVRRVDLAPESRFGVELSITKGFGVYVFAVDQTYDDGTGVRWSAPPGDEFEGAILQVTGRAPEAGPTAAQEPTTAPAAPIGPASSPGGPRPSPSRATTPAPGSGPGVVRSGHQPPPGGAAAVVGPRTCFHATRAWPLPRRGARRPWSRTRGGRSRPGSRRPACHRRAGPRGRRGPADPQPTRTVTTSTWAGDLGCGAARGSPAADGRVEVRLCRRRGPRGPTPRTRACGRAGD